MQNEAWKQAQQSNDVHAPHAVAFGPEQQVAANQCLDAERPPEVDTAGQGELQIAAEDALLDKAHQQKSRRPQPGELEDFRTGERDRPKMEPAAPGQRAHQSRERGESRHQAGNEMQRTPWPSQVEVEQASAALDQRHQRGRAHHPQERDQLAEECRKCREVGLGVEKMGLDQQRSHGGREQEEQGDEDRDRPACAQTPRTYENPPQAAIFFGAGGES